MVHKSKLYSTSPSLNKKGESRAQDEIGRPTSLLQQWGEDTVPSSVGWGGGCCCYKRGGAETYRKSKKKEREAVSFVITKGEMKSIDKRMGISLSLIFVEH